MLKTLTDNEITITLIAGYWLRIQQNNDDKVFDL